MGRFVVTVFAVSLVGCAFTGRGEEGGLAPDEELATIRDDTAADFAQTPTLDLAAIAARGALEPDAFVLHGLRARAYFGRKVEDDSSWAEVLEAIAMTSANDTRGTAYRQVPADWVGERPFGLGLVDQNNDFTVIYEGEILLPEGDTVLELDIDDIGFVEIDTGEGFANQLRGASSGITMRTITSAGGWHPIRIAFTEHNVNARLRLALDGTTVSRDVLRSRVTHDSGLILEAFERFKVQRRGAIAVTTTDLDFGSGTPPFDLLDLSNAYDLRLSGQFLVDTAGTYALAPVTHDTDDIVRLWVDRRAVAAAGIPGTMPNIATLELTAGWHDLLVDVTGAQSKLDGASDSHGVRLNVLLTSPGGQPAPIASDHLRPAVAFGVTAGAVEARTGLSLLDANGNTPTDTSIPLAPPKPTGAVIDAIDVIYTFRQATVTDYSVALHTGTDVLPIPPTGAITYLAADETFAGRPMPDAPWQLVVTDNVQGGPGDPKIYFANVALTGHGGPEQPFAPAWSYISSVRSTARALRFGRTRLAADLRGATLMMQLRTADSAESIDGAMWVDVVPGEVVTAPAGEFLQYRLAVTGDGWQFPAIEQVEIEYVVPRDAP